MRRVPFAWALLGLLSMTTQAADKYDGPRPPKPDIPYLLHGANLIPTEVANAKQEDKKDESIYLLSGATSSARTPLAEPIFLIEADKVNPEHIDLWRLETKGGQREIVIPRKIKRSGPHTYRVMVSRIEGKLYKIEVAQTLENGEYSLSPNDSNQAFCFTVF